MFVFFDPPSSFSTAIQAAGCYCEHAGRLLFLKRHRSRPSGETWGVPGGKLEAGELPLEAVVREVNEETGLVLQPDKLFFVEKVYIQNGEIQYVFHMFRTRFEEELPSILLNEEHTEYTWVTPKEALRLPLIPGGVECLRFAFKGEL